MSESFWSSDRAAEALQPLIVGDVPRGSTQFHRVSTDTRTIVKGDLFVALKGENHDAHTHLAEAVASGALGLVVSDAKAAV